MKKFYLFFTIFFHLIPVVGILSCTNDDIVSDITNSNPVYIENFAFLKADNPQLKEDIVLSFDGDSIIEVFIPQLEDKNLVATYSGKFLSTEVDGVFQKSGKTSNDFSQPVRYTFHGVTDTVSYTIKLRGNNGIPVVRINTISGEDIVSKDEYVDAWIHFSNQPDWHSIDSLCKIKGRGHGSWDCDKKPYKIKFNKRTSVFGNPACKDWVLLSLYDDRSLIRTSLMFELSQRAGFEYTANYQHVDLYLNNVYRGVYLLTDQIEADKNRVQVEDDGFLIEQDKYYESEVLWFTTFAFYYQYVFKYPNADKGKIVKDDDRYNYISDYMVNVEKAIKDIEQGDLSTYRDYIDVRSFARWYMCEQLLANYDVNYYYILPSLGEKLYAGPLWDADWSLGNGGIDLEGWFKPPFQIDPQAAVLYRSTGYYKWLTLDPYFNEVVYEEWSKVKNVLPQIPSDMEQLCLKLQYAQHSNFYLWPILGVYRGNWLTNFATWKEETDYVIDFFVRRCEWAEDYFSRCCKTK